MGGRKGTLDSFRVEEAYSWRDDIMEITRRIVKETDEARLNNIAEHFGVDLSEIREFLESKQKRMGKPITNYDRLVSKTPEELADYLRWHNDLYSRNGMDWLDWLKEEVEDGD